MYTQLLYTLYMRFSPTISSYSVAKCIAFEFRHPGLDSVSLWQLSAEGRGAQNPMHITNRLNMNQWT